NRNSYGVGTSNLDERIGNISGPHHGHGIEDSAYIDRVGNCGIHCVDLLRGANDLDAVGIWPYRAQMISRWETSHNTRPHRYPACRARVQLNPYLARHDLRYFQSVRHANRLRQIETVLARLHVLQVYLGMDVGGLGPAL